MELEMYMEGFICVCVWVCACVRYFLCIQTKYLNKTDRAARSLPFPCFCGIFFWLHCMTLMQLLPTAVLVPPLSCLAAMHFSAHDRVRSSDSDAGKRKIRWQETGFRFRGFAGKDRLSVGFPGRSADLVGWKISAAIGISTACVACHNSFPFAAAFASKSVVQDKSNTHTRTNPPRREQEKVRRAAEQSRATHFVDLPGHAVVALTNERKNKK